MGYPYIGVLSALVIVYILCIYCVYIKYIFCIYSVYLNTQYIHNIHTITNLKPNKL